jgi:hypothetical protein
MNNEELIKSFLEECANDGVSIEKVPFELKGFLRAMSVRQDSADLYRKSQDAEWIKTAIANSGVKFPKSKK